MQFETGLLMTAVTYISLYISFSKIVYRLFAHEFSFFNLSNFFSWEFMN